MTASDHRPAVNWAGNVTYRARRLVRPGSVEELQELVAASSAAGEHVRALGSRHSFSRVADTDGVHVDTRGLGLAVEVERRPEGTVAVVPGGATYAEVAPVLQDHGLALHNLASLPHISVAGACATGTHGSGDRNSARSRRRCAPSSSSPRRARWSASTRATPASAGRCCRWVRSVSSPACGCGPSRPTTYARRCGSTCRPTRSPQQLAEVMASGTSVSVFTDFADPARISSVWVKDRVDRPSTLAPCLAAHRPADHEVHPVPGVDPAAATPQQGAVGPWHERLPHFRASHVPSVGDELQSEVFLPRAAAAHLLPTLTAITDVVAPALMVHEIRAVAADDLWLSPLRGRDSVVAHFTWKPDVARAMVAIRAVEDALAQWEPRVHWGKLTATEELRAPDGVYDLAAFHDLCARLDPGGTFRNDLVPG